MFLFGPKNLGNIMRGGKEKQLLRPFYARHCSREFVAFTATLMTLSSILGLSLASQRPFSDSFLAYVEDTEDIKNLEEATVRQLEQSIRFKDLCSPLFFLSFFSCSSPEFPTL